MIVVFFILFYNYYIYFHFQLKNIILAPALKTRNINI